MDVNGRTLDNTHLGNTFIEGDLEVTGTITIDGAQGSLAQSTGLISGGEITINANTAKFDLEAGTGQIIDSKTDPAMPDVIPVSWATSTAIAVTDLATSHVQYISIDSTGAILQSITMPSQALKRSQIYLGYIYNTNLTTISDIYNEPETVANPMNSLSDLSKALGYINVSGNIISGNGLDMSLIKSAGSLYSAGSNFHTDSDNPNIKTIAALDSSVTSWRYISYTGAYSGNSQVVIDNVYDNVAGGLINQAVPSVNWTIQRIYVSFLGNWYGMKGQILYTSLSDAKNGIFTDPFTTPDIIKENTMLLAYIIIKSGSTTIPADQIVTAGNLGSGATGVSDATSLQTAFDNSTAPQIVADVTNTGLDIKAYANTNALVTLTDTSDNTPLKLLGNGVIRTKLNGTVESVAIDCGTANLLPALAIAQGSCVTIGVDLLDNVSGSYTGLNNTLIGDRICRDLTAAGSCCNVCLGSEICLKTGMFSYNVMLGTKLDNKTSSSDVTNCIYIGDTLYNSTGFNRTDVIAIGENIQGGSAAATQTIGIGKALTIDSDYSICMGSNSICSSDYGIGIGWTTTSSGDRAIAVGSSATASGSYSIALGNSATTAVDRQLVLGGPTISTTALESVVPGLTANMDLGSSSLLFKNLYLSNSSFVKQGKQYEYNSVTTTDSSVNLYPTKWSFEYTAIDTIEVWVAEVYVSGCVGNSSGELTNTAYMTCKDTVYNTDGYWDTIESVNGIGKISVYTDSDSTTTGRIVVRYKPDVESLRVNVQIKLRVSRIDTVFSEPIESLDTVSALTDNKDANLPKFIAGYLQPNTDNIYKLGSASYRWNEIFCTNATINTSDERMKTDIEPLVDSLAFVEALRPVKYRWKEDGKRLHYGMIAQEVRDSLTEDFGGFIDCSKSGEECDRLGLRYQEFIAPLIGSVKELSSIVKLQQIQMQALRDQTQTFLQSLHKQIKALQPKPKPKRAQPKTPKFDKTDESLTV